MTTPVDHLASMGGGYTHILLMQLTDQQLAEQHAWFRHRRVRLLAEPPDGRTYGNRYAAYRMIVSAGVVDREQLRRKEQRRSGAEGTA